MTPTLVASVAFAVRRFAGNGSSGRGFGAELARGRPDHRAERSGPSGPNASGFPPLSHHTEPGCDCDRARQPVGYGRPPGLARAAMTDALDGKEIALHDAGGPAAGEELERLRTQVLDRAFPPEERLDDDALDEAREQPLLIACVQGEVVGGALGKLYPDSETLYLRYLATRPDLRGRGVGTRLVEGFRERWVDERTFAVLGAEDPRHHPGHHQYGDPSARLRFYARFGVEAVGIPYFQPRFQSGGERKHHLLLCVLGAPTDMRMPGGLVADRVARFLSEFFVDAEGPGALEDPDLQSLLRACRGPFLSLTPLVDPGKVPNTEPPGGGGVR